MVERARVVPEEQGSANLVVIVGEGRVFASVVIQLRGHEPEGPTSVQRGAVPRVPTDESDRIGTDRIG